MDTRARLLRAAGGFALVAPTEPELQLLHRWLDCWRGVGERQLDDPALSRKRSCWATLAAVGLLANTGRGGLTKPTRRTTMPSTKDVLDHHLKCFGEGDLKGILADYAPGAVLFTPDGPLKGTDAIRPLFEAIFAEFGKPGAAFKMKQQSIEGDYAYILWTAETADNVYEVGTDTFVVRDGKIIAQSFAGKITPKG